MLERVLKEINSNDVPENKKIRKDLKEIRMLQEKIGKIQVNFQKVVQEKSHLSSEIASKEKEFMNLQKKYEILLHSLEKADKIAHNYVDKACKAETYEKKLQNFSSKTTKLKEIADKRLLQENEELNGKISQAGFSKSELERARKEYKIMQKELNKSCESFETQRLAYLERINDLESELEAESDKFKAFKEEKNLEISQIQKNMLFFKKQTEELESELTNARQKHSQLLQKMEVENNLKEKNQNLIAEIGNAKNHIQELSIQVRLTNNKLAELKAREESLCQEIEQEKMMRSTQSDSFEKEKEALLKEVQHLKKQLSRNEASANSLLEKEKLISAGLSQKIKDLSESIALIQNKLTACTAELENERAEYKMNISILESSREKSDTDFKLQIGLLKDQINEMNDDTVKKEEYYQSLLNEEKQISADLSLKVRNQGTKISSMEEYLDMQMLQNKKDVGELNDEMTNLESKYRQAQNELSQVISKLENLESLLSANESSHGDETANMLSRISDLEFLKGKLNGQVQESQNLIQEQNTMIQKLEDSLNEKSVNMQSLSQKFHTMEEEMKELMKKFTKTKVALEEEKNAHEQTKQVSEHRISELEKEINEVYQNSTDKDKLLQSLLESEKQKSNTFARKIVDLESNVVSLEEEITSITKKSSQDIQLIQMEMTDMKSKNDELMNEYTLSQTDLAKTKEEYLSLTDSYNSMEASMKSDLKILEEKNQILMTELSGSLSDNAAKSQMVENLEENVLKKDATIANLNEDLYCSNEELKLNLDKLEKLKLELKDRDENIQNMTDFHEKNMHSLKAETLELNCEKNELNAKIGVLEAELNVSREAIKENDISKTSSEEKIANLSSIIEEMEQKITDLRKEIANLESSHENKAMELAHNMEISKATIFTLEKEVSTRDEMIDELKNIIGEKDIQIDNLQTEVQGNAHNFQVLQDEFEANQQLFGQTQEKLIASITELKSQLEKKQKVVSALQDRLARCQNECDAAQTCSLGLSIIIQTQSAKYISKLDNAAITIANLQYDIENNLMLIKRFEDKVSDLVDQNQKLIQVNDEKLLHEKKLRDDMDAMKKLYCELETKMQSQTEDYQVELEELHESLVRDREEYKIERNYFNDQMTAMTAQLNKEIVLKENEMELCRDLSEKLDNIKKQKYDLESKLKELSLKYADQDLNKFQDLQAQVENLTSALDFKSNLLKNLESQLEESQSRLSVAELRLLNELSSKEMHFKSFEDRLKSKCSEVENLTKSHLEMKKNLLKVKDENKSLLSEYEKSKASIARFKEVERLVLVEKKNLESGHKESVFQVEKYKKEIANLKSLVKDLTESNSDLSQLYTNQAEIISSQGALNTSEMEKISNLNAELAGHSNSRQKIKYVSNIKQENLALRKENSNLLIERDQLNQRIQSLLADNASLGPII